MKIRLILLLLLGTILLSGFLISSKKDVAPMALPPASQRPFMQNPPIATKFFVQRLRIPLPTGENLIFSVQFVYDGQLPETIDIYKGTGIDIVLKDDGTRPDQIRGDKKYSAFMKEDIVKMVAKIDALEAEFASQKQVLHFTGHVGEFTSNQNLIKFNKLSFRQYLETEIDIRSIDPVDCVTDLIKEKSLFITDISIVEDQSRTYNVATGTGAPSGVWTFGTLMDNMENGTHSDGVRGFLKAWVKQWLTTQTVNGYAIASRDFAMENLIAPWLQKANANPSLAVDISNWEGLWDATPENDVKINAPFKITAIINRIDLRANVAYTAGITNSGETRFIFTLINPYTGIKPIPINPNQSASAEQNDIGLIDWRGMNVIFEYGNVQTNRCDLKAFAQQWLDLSDPSYSFGTASVNNPYKIALQAITDQVTAANAAPSKPNGSAINRIRTNEKAFATFGTDPDSHVNWEKQDWEFRQFEIGASSQILDMVPLTNNPPHTANYAINIDEDYTSSPPLVTYNNILTWIFSGNKFKVLNGNFNMPTSLLSGSGIVRREETQFFNFKPEDYATAGGYNPLNPSPEAKKIRQQLSLNTCAGCHAGETKTVFTHVNALAYGEQAKYWPSVIDGASGIPQDNALYPNGGTDPLMLGGKNDGITVDDILGSVINFDTQTEILNRDFFQAVSPFLTGRRYFVKATSTPGFPNWQDDEIDDANTVTPFENIELTDDGMDGLFYVNDPSNEGGTSFPYLERQKWGFNDLKRRKDDLCMLVNQDCNSSNKHTVFDLMVLIRFLPLPKGGH